MKLSIEQLRQAILKEQQQALRYRLAKSPALAKFYDSQAKKYQKQLEAELAELANA